MKRILKGMRACLLAVLIGVLPWVCCFAEDMPDAIADAIVQETSTNYDVNGSIPGEYQSVCVQAGMIEGITYETRDYFGDGAIYTKHAFVYLPYGYSTDRRCKVLILCHGIGGNGREWGMTDDRSRVKLIMDNLIRLGQIEPFIVVTPNGRAGDMTRNGIDRNSAYMAFYLFGQELRNDLLPYLDEHYSTYGSGASALSDAREYRAMAGLSMGGMQTINIGMCECLDLFAWFGAFSAAPTSYTAPQIAAKLNAFPDDEIRFFYNICGTGDNVAFSSASSAARNLMNYTDRLTEKNFVWQERPGGHDFAIWYLGFFNFARIFGAKQ